jgi:tetratricopeptide (TPR) repeat protein
MRWLIALTLLISLISGPLAIAESLAPVPSVDTVSQVTDLLARSRVEDAYETAVRWHEAEPQNPRAAYWAGSMAGQMAMRSGMFKAMGLAKESRKGLQQAVALDPNDVDAQYALMQFYLMAPGMMGGDKDEAAAIAKRIAALSPAEGHRAEAQLRWSEKDADGYLRGNQAALTLAPAHRDALAAVVAVLLGKSDFDGAKVLIDKARAADPDSVAVRYQYVKWVAVSGRETEAGLAEIEALIALPRYPDRFTLTGAHYRRAQLLAKLGRKDDAILAYQAALDIEPKFELASKELEALQEG